MRITKVDWFFFWLILICATVTIIVSVHQGFALNKTTDLPVVQTEVVTLPTEPIIEPITEPTTEPVVETIETTTSVEVHEPVFRLSESERSMVEGIVMGEAGGESYEGQVLVAQCILNGSLKEGLQPSELRIRYQYSGWNAHVTDSVRKAVSAVFDYGFKVTEEEILYFYNPNMTYSRWHESMRYVLTEGNHKFFADWS